MKKIIVLLLLLFNVLNANSAEEVRLKIERALACNARITSVSDVQIATLEKSTQYKGAYYVEGVYRSTSSVRKEVMGFTLGDGFNPSSGAFEALVDKDLKVKKIHWKLGMMQGYVKNSCLLSRQRRF